MIKSHARRLPAAAVALCAAAAFVLASCQTVPPLAVPPDGALPAGRLLVCAGPSTTVSATRVRTALELASLPLLQTQIDTSGLRADGYDLWRSSALQRSGPVQAVKIVFRTELVPGVADVQSGMLLLPARGGEPPLDWVVYAKGTELNRLEVPSRLGGAEMPISLALAGLGYAVWCPDYAGMGDSPGIHTYCVPESLAASCLDGLEACREYMAWLGSQADVGLWRESGRLHVMGYSEGGLAAMATARALERRPPAGLTTVKVYAMGAPLDLTTNSIPFTASNEVIVRPVYHVFLVLGWARAFPDRIDPRAILSDAILAKVVPLIDGTRSSSDIDAAIARAIGKPVDQIRVSDVYRPEYRERLLADPASASLHAQQTAERLDRWTPAGAPPILLAASPHDTVVPPSNTDSAAAWITENAPGQSLDLIELGSTNHVTAGGEALLRAILRIDRQNSLAGIPKNNYD